MKTLVIHPKDASTQFLDVVYKDIKDVEVVTGGLHRSQLALLMGKADRVMMMGHGSPSGLFAVGRFPDFVPFAIDETFVKVLRQKQDNVFIWCHASDFVHKHRLHGFSTGMFISEVTEAHWVLPRATAQTVHQAMVDDSNMCFVNEFAEVIRDRHSDEAYKIIAEGQYRDMARTNVVACYNYERLRSYTKSEKIDA